MAQDDEQVLVARLSAGDTGAFDEVYDVYRPRVFAFLLRMTRNRALAEDLLDETWLRLVRHAARLLPDTRLGPWLFTVARNLYWSHRRDALLEESFVPELLTLWPSPAPWPSPFDLTMAMPCCSYWILQVRDGKAVDSRSWQRTEDGRSFVEEEILLEG